MNKLNQNIHQKTILAILCFFLVTLNGYIFGQAPVTIPNTVELALDSNINNTKYKLHIALPYGYEKSTEEYPTIYLLDSNSDFPLVTSISRRLQSEDDLKKFIIVGISYEKSAWHHRRGDYTPSNAQNIENSGGAPNFANIIQQEVIPIIEQKFRVKGNSRTLLGHSLGGLFGTYLLVNDRNLFDNYIISSPSVWWDDYFVLKNDSSTFSKKAIFLTVGALENPHMLESCNKLSAFIDNKLTSSSKKVVVLGGENHASAKIRAYTDGLRWLFKDDSL